MNIQTRNNKDVTINFFDGETIDNKYVLLSNQEKYIFNPKGLDLQTGLRFLFETGLGTKNFFFRISYDLNMLFAKEELTKKVISFFEGETENFYGYEVQYFTDKIFIIKHKNKKVTFFDISNFFKTSFIKTLEILGIEIEKNDLKLLNKYKNLRAGFNIQDIKNIILYNKTECKYGIKIVNKIYSLIPENLKTYSLYGSSVLANKFLTFHQIDKKALLYSYSCEDKFINSYFGGRMEALKIGTFINCYKYDINSAYPNTIKDLREIKSIKKLKYKNQKIKNENVYKIKLEIFDKNICGLLPVRLKTGYIIFPDLVEGWFFGYEVQTVLNYSKLYNLKIKIFEFYEIGFGELLFNNEIQKLYKIRQKLKEQNDLKNYIYKILLNSIYGKFAQSIGTPKFRNIYYAGLITSHSRSILLNSVIKNPYNVIFFATDGILSKDKLNLPISFKLGDFEEIKIKKAIVLLSGVYYLIDSNDKIIKGERGYKFNFEDILEQIKTKKTAIVKTNIFIGNKYYNKNKKAFRGFRCKFKEIIKVVSPENQFKRLFDFNNKSFNLDKQYNSFLINTLSIKKYLEVNNGKSKKNNNSERFKEFI